MTPHGLRSSFRSWCAEQGINREVAEMSLGHTVRGVEGAYQRSDLLDARAEVMEQWGHHLSGKAPDNDTAPAHHAQRATASCPGGMAAIALSPRRRHA